MIRQTLNDWPQLARDWTHEDREAGCLVWLRSTSPKGYGFVRIDGHWGPAHRVAYRYYHGPIPSDSHILHDCDNPSCVNPLHLRAGTNAENIAEKVAKDRAGKKLTLDQVLEIRRFAATGGTTQAEIAKQYGVSPQTISRIVSGTRWRMDHPGRLMANINGVTY